MLIWCVLANEIVDIGNEREGEAICSNHTFIIGISLLGMT